jgi:hypothetical protein
MIQSNKVFIFDSNASLSHPDFTPHSYNACKWMQMHKDNRLRSQVLHPRLKVSFNLRFISVIMILDHYNLQAQGVLNEQ